MSGSDDEPSKGAPDEDKQAGSLFDSPWAPAGNKPLFTPPPVPSFAPPKTSESGAVSGEIGESAAAKADDAPAEAAKADDTPAEPAPSDDAPAEAAKAESETSDDKPANDKPADDKPANDDDRHAGVGQAPPRPPPPPEPSRSTSTWLVLAVLAGILLAIWYVSNASRSHEGGEGPSKPNAKAPGDPATRRPAPRLKVVTHSKDRHARPTGSKPTTEPTGEPTSEPTSDGGEVEAPPTEPAPEDEPPAEPEPPTELEPPPQPRPHVDNPRDPSLIPSGTPAENAKAFGKLPVAPSDGPPIGGIGRSGIHIDGIEMGQGRDNSSCDQPTRAFTTDTEFINVCFRVVHPRASETLRVFWEKDGTVTRRGKVRIPENLHAYKTRAYLQVRPEYVGKWRVRIVPEGEESIDLAVAEFEITD